VAAPSRLDNAIALAKRRGFVFPSGEIYGGTRSAWDYGPLGVELKENIKRQWWRFMVTSREDIVGLDSSVILPRQVWVASGHVGVFTDPLTECLHCHKRFREDQLIEEFTERKGHEPEGGLASVPCPNCGTKGQWTEPRDFNMMLKTYLGPVEDESGLHYLRPETAQGIFVNFANVLTAARKKPPFGIGQIGKSFRNEITPGNFIFRTREFEQMEMEYFVEPGTDETWHQYWIDVRTDWYVGLGIARQIAHQTYRSARELDERFGRIPQGGEEPLEGGRFAVQSYLDHHGDKLARRFDANTYVTLTRTMITHDLGRDRGGVEAALAGVTARALVVAVDSDRLFTPAQSERIAAGIRGAGPVRYVRSEYGHDGFLIEEDQVGALVADFLGDDVRVR